MFYIRFRQYLCTYKINKLITCVFTLFIDINMTNNIRNDSLNREHHMGSPENNVQTGERHMSLTGANELRDISTRNSHILITGDFNYRGINWIEWSTYENTTRNNCFMEVVRDAYIHQHLMVPTRFRMVQRTQPLTSF